MQIAHSEVIVIRVMVLFFTGQINFKRLRFDNSCHPNNVVYQHTKLVEFICFSMGNTSIFAHLKRKYGNY